MQPDDELFSLSGYSAGSTGLTVREWIAVQAMQGLIATHQPQYVNAADIATQAFEMADAMIARSRSR